MGHKYRVGQEVYYNPRVRHTAASGTYKIVGKLPIEGEGRLAYRIKSAAETLERIQLTRPSSRSRIESAPL